MSKTIVTLDVRGDIRNGHEPFTKIMDAVAHLSEDENLRLLAPFEPVPLFSVLARQGFGHAGREIENGDWEVLFARNGKNETSKTTINTPAHPNENRDETKTTEVVEVDARGLEPPQPMVKILETLAALPDGATLRAITDRRPMHLYAQLEVRGYTSQTEEQNDGSFITIIRRN